VNSGTIGGAIGGLGLGLWTFERPPLPNPDEDTSSPPVAPAKRMCVSYSAARSIGGLATESGFFPYYEYFGNSDRPWSLSRVFAALGALSGCIACVVLVMILTKRKRRRRQSKVLIAQATTCAFLSESIKFGLFFNNYYCTSPSVWLSGGGGSAECDLDRGSTASVFSLLTYLSLTVVILLHLARPPNARHKTHYNQDEVSVPSFLHSVGMSVANSKQTSSVMKSNGSSCGNAIAAPEKFIDRREYFRMQMHRPQLPTVTESSRAPKVPVRPPPKRIALTADQSVYTNALSSVGMGTAGLDGHSLPPRHPHRASSKHGDMQSSFVAASTAPSRIQFLEEKYHLPDRNSEKSRSSRQSRSDRDPKGLHRNTSSSEYMKNMEASRQSRRTRYNDGRIHSDPYGTHRSPQLATKPAPSSRSAQLEAISQRMGGSDRHLYNHLSSNNRRLRRAPSSRIIDSNGLSFHDLEQQAPRRQRSYRSFGAGTSVGMGTVGMEGPAGSGEHFIARGA